MGQQLVALEPDLVVLALELVVLALDRVVLALDLVVLVLDLVVQVLDQVVLEPDKVVLVLHPVVLVLDPVVLGLGQMVTDEVAMGQGVLGLDPGLAILDLDPLDKVDMGQGVLVLDHKVPQQAVLAMAEWVQDQAAMVLVGLALEVTLSVVKDMGNESHSNQVSLCDIDQKFAHTRNYMIDVFIPYYLPVRHWQIALPERGIYCILNVSPFSDLLQANTGLVV